MKKENKSAVKFFAAMFLSACAALVAGEQDKFYISLFPGCCLRYTGGGLCGGQTAFAPWQKRTGGVMRRLPAGPGGLCDIFPGHQRHPGARPVAGQP